VYDRTGANTVSTGDRGSSTLAVALSIAAHRSRAKVALANLDASS
jgi:hypothetical protein